MVHETLKSLNKSDDYMTEEYIAQSSLHKQKNSTVSAILKVGII